MEESFLWKLYFKYFCNTLGYPLIRKLFGLSSNFPTFKCSDAPTDFTFSRSHVKC